LAMPKFYILIQSIAYLSFNKFFGGVQELNVRNFNRLMNLKFRKEFYNFTL